MASKSLTIKVPVSKVIKALETKLTEVEKNYSNQETNEANYQKTLDAWKKQAAKLLVDNFSKAENIRIAPRYNGSCNIDFDIPKIKLPEEPSRNFESMLEWKYRESKEEINNALRVLRMTDEQYVSTSTMKSINQYL